MSLYARDFSTLNEILFTRRLRALEIIFSYLEQDDFKSLMEFCDSYKVKEALLPPELEFIQGITRKHYGISIKEEDVVHKKDSH